MSLFPATKHFKVWRGSTFHYRFTWLSAGRGSAPRVITGYTGTLTIKDNDGNTLLVLTTENGGLIFTGLTGDIDIIINDTSSLTWTQGNYELMVQAPGGGDLIPLLRGGFSVTGL